MNKKGVSLITVLMFMLVATIAATATFKWLSSENRSSASRMLQTEAGQAALAGIESARSWMTYNGNNVGAIVKQYFDNGKMPVKLNLNSMGDDAKQKFDVAVVGVDVSGTTYKIKIVSVGEARNGSRYSESAVFKVTGLYQVDAPEEDVPITPVKYAYSYFGSTTTYSGEHEASAMLINGNWSGNPSKVNQDFIVTGNVELSGNDIDVGNTMCVGGNLGTQNHFKGKDIYVEGKAGYPVSYTTEETCYESVWEDGWCGQWPYTYPCKIEKKIKKMCTVEHTAESFSGNITGDAYFNGDVTMGATEDFVIGGNTTLNGIFETNLGGHLVHLTGDFCVGDNGKVNINGDNYNFTVDGNVYMPGHNPVFKGTDNHDSYSQITLGGSGKNVYIADAYAFSDYRTMRDNTKKFTEKKDLIKEILGANNFNYWGKDHWVDCGPGGFGPHCRNERQNEDYKPYVDVPPKAGEDNKRYYMYYVAPGEIDVVFKEDYYDVYWKKTVGAYMVGGTTVTTVLDGVDNRYQNYNTNNPRYSFYHSDGVNITGTPYCKKSAQNYRPECGVSPWFKSLGTVSRSMPSDPLQCAKPVKDYCDKIWKKKPGCDGSSYRVNDMLSTGLSKFESYAEKAREKCANITTYDANIVTNLNNCYETLKTEDPDKLYNGYLVAKLSSTGKVDPAGSYSGKFILIFEETINSQQAMAPTEEGSYVMLYLKGGTAGELLQSGSGTYNYFVYTEGDIAQIQGTEWKGSFYAKVGNDELTCAKIGNINGSTKLTFDQTLVDDMTKAGLICDWNASETCEKPSATSSPSASTGEESGATTSRNGRDTYHVATGAQLNVELESQYKTTESVSQVQAIEPSVMVMPRYVYLNKDAVGSLSDYFTVLHLNGAETGSGQVTSCLGVSTRGSIPVSGLLAADHNMVEDTYTCNYTEGEFRSHFYVTVVGSIATTPSVQFNAPSSLELSSSEATSNVVQLIVDPITTATPKPFTVDIVIKNATLSGWTITPNASENITEIPGTSTEKIYRFSGNAGVDGFTVDAFTVSTNSSSASGSVLFMLQTPENATIGSRATKSFSIVGKTTIKRASIEAYCAAFPDNCTGANSKFATAASVEDCNQGGTWVRANGTGCYEKISNEQWDCAAGNGSSNPITLVAGSVSSLCELLLPTEDNSVVAALDNAENADGYTLYASIKRKRNTLTVDLDGASSAKVKVNVRDTYDGDIKQTEECSNQCSYEIYAGKYVEIVAIKNGDRFNYWTCSGTGCPTEPIMATSYKFVMENNYTYTAKFNERDPNCFFTDFTDMDPVFCAEGSSKQDCIDHCASGTDHCALNNGRNGSTPNWLMTYCNTGNNCRDWHEPGIDGGFISNYNKKNANSGNGTTAPVLNRALAGSNGTMTVSIKTSGSENLKGSNAKNQFLNSGIVLRSNADASDYLILNIYGKSIVPAGTYARICHVSGRSIQNENMGGCWEKQFKIKGSSTLSPIITNNTVIDLSINLHNEKIHIDFKYENDGNLLSGLVGWVNADVEFDLSNTSKWSAGLLNETGHDYVGFNLSDTEFKVGQIGWKADNLTGGGTCFDYPSISCSFAAKFEGGYVPLEKDVKPWIGFSAWFDEEDHAACKESIEYYYNGCDMYSSYYNSWLSGISNNALCGSIGADGYYENKIGDDGLKLAPSKDGTYNFRWEGPHGVPKGAGIVRNAGVKVTCQHVEYFNSCGYFNVGTITQCSRNYSLLSNTEYLTTNPVDFEFASSNLRGATLLFNVDFVGDEDYAEVVLIDENNIESYSRTISKNNLSLDVGSMSDVQGFNPEKVNKIRLKGSYSYTLNSVSSACPNALNISCSRATYSGSNWNVAASVGNAQNAEKCEIEVVPQNSSISKPARVDCNTASNNYLVADADFYERLNGPYGVSGEEKFTVNVYDRAGSSVPVDHCIASSAVNNKASVSCDLSTTSVIQGLGVPVLSYTVRNCPDYGCYYDVELSNGTSLTTKDPNPIPQSGFSGAWQPGVNSISSYLSKGGYTYRIRIHNSENTTTYDECEKSFEVTEAVEVNASCELVGNQIKITVSGANNKDATVHLYYNDMLGNTITSEPISMGVETHEKTVNLTEFSDRFAAGQSYTFAVADGVHPGIACTGGAYKPTKPLSIGNCPSSFSDRDKSGTITFDPGVEGCEDGTCSWNVDNGSVDKTSGYTNGDITVSNLGADSYTLTLTHGTDTRTCNFNVSYKAAEPDFNVDCGTIAKQSDKNQGSTITANPHQVTGCGNNDCHYEVSLGGSPVTAGSNKDSYDGGNFSFIGANSAGDKTYSVKIYNPDKSKSETCNMVVNFKDETPSTCTEDSGNWIIDQYNNNKTITVAVGNNSCKEYRTEKRCSNIRVQASTSAGTGSFKVNGKEFNCGSYAENNITPKETIKIEASSTCSVFGSIDVWNCVAGGSDVTDVPFVSSGAVVTLNNISDGNNNSKTMKNGDCATIIGDALSSGANFRCKHGWQSDNCTISIYGAETTPSTYSINNCNSSPGDPFPISSRKSNGQICISLSGATSMECIVTSW